MNEHLQLVWYIENKIFLFIFFFLRFVLQKQISNLAWYCTYSEFYQAQ